MKKIFLFVFFLIIALSINKESNASDVGTKFQMYIPANAITVGYYVAVYLTAIDDSTYFSLVDDNADGDNDDSYNGFLRQGETYIRYIKDGTINDDASGKWDGDYFILNSNKPVIFGQFTKGDYAHDWALSTNGSPKGKQFYIYAPQSVDSPRDINVFAYENSTTVTLKDITSTTQNATGIAKVNLNSNTTVFSTSLNTNQDLITIKTNGRNVLANGKTYLLTANKDVTVQYGTLYVSARDGGSYVPGSTGSCLGTSFTFAIPNENDGEQEVRIMSYNNNVVATLQRINSSGSWVTLGTYNLNQNKYANWFADDDETFDLFRVTVTGGKVSVFEGNWFETGTGTPSTFDDFTYTPTNLGNKPGKEFMVYIMPPSDEDDNVDPFTGLKYRQLTSDGKFSHVYVYTTTNTSVRVRDAATSGTVIDTTFNVSAGRYFDYKINTTKYNSLTSGSREPFLYFVSTQPVVACQASWNDNWMTVASSMNSVEVTIASDFNPDSVYSGSNSVLTGYVKNDGADFTVSRKLVLTIPDGLTYVTSNLRTSAGNVGAGTLSTGANNIKTLTWTGFAFALGDSNVFTLTAKAESNYFNGTAIASGTNFSVPSVFTGITSLDTSIAQSSAVLKVKNSNANVVNDDYIVAFEDLKNSSWNDWDVNDWVAGIRQSVEADSLNRVKKITLKYEALARGSNFNHAFYQKVNITGNSTVSLSVFDTSGNAVPSLSFTNQAKTGAFTVTVFPSTKQALPAATGSVTSNTLSGQNYMKRGYTATMVITLNNTSNLLSSFNNTTFDPYIVTEFGNTIKVASIAGLTGNTQNVDNNVISTTPLYGYFLDLAYKVPYDWKWPYEGPAYPIWVSYPQFVNYIQSGKLLSQDWYDFPNESKVWQRRVVTTDRQKRTIEEVESEQHQHISDLQKDVAGTSVFVDSIDKFFSSPKLADINGDGTLEVLVGSVDTKFYVLDNNGNDLPGFPTPTSGMVRSTAAVDTAYGDLTVIAFGSDDGYLYAVTGMGELLPGFPINTGGAIKSSPMIVDLRNDGNKYIVVFSGNGMLSAYNMQGQIQPGFPKKIQETQDTYGSFLILPSPAAADLFSDGSREIIIGTIDSALYVINPAGNVLSGFPVRLDNTVYSSPVVAQFSDKSNKIIVATGGGTLYIINRNGSIFNQIKLADEIISSPVIADIDNDGSKEIIVGTTDGFIYCLNAENLAVKWEFQTVAEVLSSPIIADLNGDDYLEIIVPSMIGRTLILDRFGVVDAQNANLVTIFDSWIISGPAIGDIDNNGKLDLVLASFDKTVRAFEMPSSTPQSKVVWGSFGYNLGNTRWNESDYIPPDQPNELGRIFNYPNPVTTERTTVRAELPLNVEAIDLKIFDLGGELVKEVSKTDFIRNGIYWDYTWDLQNGKNVPVANGVYLFFIEAKLNGNTYKKNQKMGVAR